MNSRHQSMNGNQVTLTGESMPSFKETSWLKQWDTKDHSPEGIMKEAIEHYTIPHKRKTDETPTFWVASSGGNDSMVVADILDKMGLLAGVFHIRIPGGSRKNFEWLQDYCENVKGWRFEYRYPKPMFIMVALMLETGCPSYFLHPMYMSYLKKETTERFVKEKENRESNIVMATGIRKFESERRFGNFEFPIQVAEQNVRYVCPIFYYEDQEKYQYTVFNKVKSSPTKQYYGHSGECPCGSFAHPHEANEIDRYEPETAHYLKWIEYGIRHFGTETAKKYSKWGSQGMTEAEAQQYLDSNFTEKEQQSMKMAEAIHCGVECGPSTMRGELDY